MSIQDDLREHGEGVYEKGVERMVRAAADRIDALEAAVTDALRVVPNRGWQTYEDEVRAILAAVRDAE